MTYNLIDERWIPVERRSGRVEYVAPAEIADRDDPPLRVASPRPDFDGALLEFLVALFQTAAAPARESGWRKWWSAPPVAEVKAKLDHVRNAFFLDGDGPRFMQDLDVHRDPKKSTEPIGALFIDRIGEDGLAEGPTLFAKPGGFDALGYPAAAAALMVLQSYAPAGGAGIMTSLRGGGPLTTLVAGDDLWSTVWLNVLPREVFEAFVPGAKDRDRGEIFPWMARTRDGSKPTVPTHVQPLQHLWGLPRRIRLVFDGAHGTCSVSGEPEVPIVRAYVSRPKGTSYKGAFRHPFTPYSEVTAGQPWNPKKASADGLPYRDWPLLVTGTKKREPAAVVRHFVSERRHLVEHPRVIAFGFAMKPGQMKPLRWSRAVTPLVAVAPAGAESYAAMVEQLVAVSEETRGTLSSQLREAWSDRPASLEVSGRVNPAFWSATEPAFFAAVHGAKAAIESGDQASSDATREAWLEALHRSAVELFDTFVDAAASVAPPDLGRAIVARRDLVRFTSPASRKLRTLLQLPLPDAPAEPARKGTKGRRKEKET